MLNGMRGAASVLLGPCRCSNPESLSPRGQPRSGQLLVSIMDTGSQGRDGALTSSFQHHSAQMAGTEHSPHPFPRLSVS